MVARYNNLSLALGAPGIILQIAGRFMMEFPEREGMGIAIGLLGTALLLVGLAFYAKAKGRHPAWCLMAFLSIVGLFVLACLKDHTQGPVEEMA